MAFTLSGTTIIQTGTDTSLSGLAAIAGVTVIDDFYILDALRLEIQGSLTFEARNEKIVINNYANVAALNGYRGAITVRAGATWTNTSRHGSVFVPMTVVSVSPFDAEFAGNPIGDSGQSGRAAFEVERGGTANMEGVFEAEISDNKQGIVFALNGTVRAQDVTFINKRNNINLNQQVAFTLNATEIDFNRVAVRGMNIVDRGALLISQFNEVSCGNALEAYNVGGGTASGVTERFFLVPNFSFGTSSSRDIRTNANGGETVMVELRDSNKGNSVDVTIDDAVSQNIRVYSSATLNMSFLDDTLSDVNAKYYAIDVNNGNRQADFTPVGQSLIASTGNIVYTGTAASGTAQEVVITQIIGPDDTTAFIDNRGLSNGSDLLWRAIQYNNNIATFQPVLTGLGEKSTTVILPTDSIITEPVKATVDAYSELETPQKFYDRAKSYLVDNYAGETETIVTRSGNTLDARNYNVVIDSTATPAFAFDGTTITINSTTFTGNITTTGTATLQNGANVIGGIVDSNGDSFLTFQGISSWKVYLTESDRDSNTNVDDEGTTGNYRFNYIASTTYYIRAVVGGTVFFLESTPTASGETVVTLQTEALLSSVNSKLGFIDSVVFVNTELLENGDGSQATPFNSFDDAKNYAENNNILTIKVIGDIVATSSLKNFTIEAISSRSTIDLNNQDVDGSKFKNITITGIASEVINPKGFRSENCRLIDVSGLNGVFLNSLIEGTLSPADEAKINLDGCYSGVAGLGRPTINLASKTNVKLSVRKYSGGLTLLGSTDSDNEVTISSTEMKLTLDATNTLGTVSIRGVAQLTNNSAGTIVDTTGLLETVYVNDNLANSYDDTTLISKVDVIDSNVDAIKLKTDILENTDLTGIATATDVTNSESNVIAEINSNETLINTIITNLGNLNDPDLQSIIDGVVNASQTIDVDDLKSHITAMNFAS